MASSDLTTPLPRIEDVLAAAQRTAPYLNATPVLTSRSIDALVGAPVHFKCESFQRSGSFKARGALAAVTAELDAARRRGVVTHSSGNHGAALALAGRVLNVAVTVVMPEAASRFKRAAVMRYGGRVVDCGPTLADREARLAEVREQSGALFVPPYDHPMVIAGQGTAALELVSAVPGLAELWVPVGGGGLAGGTVLVGVAAGPKVHGAEPALADDAFRSLAAGVRQPALPPRTVADGLRTALGELNFRLLRDYRLAITLVEEEAIVDAQRLLWSCLKVVVEPSSAVPLAALLAQPPEGPVGVILTGGNVDPAAL